MASHWKNWKNPYKHSSDVSEEDGPSAIISHVRQATLKEVGEWLKHRPRVETDGCGKATMVFSDELATFLQGKMPGGKE